MSILKKSLLMSTALLWGVQGTWAMFTEGYLDDQRAIPSSQSSPLGKRKEIEAEKESSHLQFGEEVNAKIPSIVTAQIQHVGLERIAHDIIFHGLNFKTEQREGFLQHHQIYPYIERTTQQFIRDALLGSIPEVFPNNEEERKLTHKDGNEGAMVRASFYNVLGDGDCLLYVLGTPRETLIKSILKVGKKDTEEALSIRNIFKVPINLEKGRDCTEDVSIGKEEFKEFVNSYRTPKEYLPPEFAFAYGQLTNKLVQLWKINPEEKTFQDYKDYIHREEEEGVFPPLHIGFVNGNHYQILVDEEAPDVELQTAFARAKENKAREQWQRFLLDYDIEEAQLFLTRAEEDDIVAALQNPEQTHRPIQLPFEQQLAKGSSVSQVSSDYTPAYGEGALDWEDSDEEQNSPTAFAPSVLSPRDQVVLAKSIYIGGKIYEVFDKILDPSKPLEFSADFSEKDLQNKGLLEIFNNKNPLLQRAKDLISDFKFNSLVTDEEYGGLMEIMVRALMVLRPHHFSLIPDSGPISSEITFKIFQSFLEEFVNSGPLEKFERFCKNKIEQEQNFFAKISGLWFLGLVTNFLRSAATKPGMLGEFLRDLSPEQMDKHLKSTLHHLKILDPSLADLNDPAMLEKYTKEKSKRREFEQLENLLKSLTTEKDLLEENFLRSFSERLHRENLGRAFYKMACESFAHPAKGNQRVRQMWALSLLDTINRAPMEARSRMPGHSFDGQTAPNFGYLMSQSPSYEEWIRQSPITLATADVIMDAFDYVTHWGKDLSDDAKNEFLDLFEFHLTIPSEDEEFEDFYENNKQAVQEYYQSPYSGPMVNFELYLLKRHFNNSKKDPKQKDALRKLADSQKVSLRTITNQHLESFIRFCSDTPQISSNNQERDRGFVFGIGFNGPLFNSPNYFYSNKDELCLAFSGSRRKENGYYLFLDFLEHFSRNPNKEFILSHIKLDDNNFLRYKPLILNHLKSLVGFYAGVDESAELFEYYEKFKRFTHELKGADSIASLSSDLMKWIQDMGNWYRIPVNRMQYIPIKIAKELSEEEKILQDSTRHLLLDALVKRPLAEEKPYLRSVLFLHWRDRVSEKLIREGDVAESEAVKTAKSFKQISEESSQKVLRTLDSFVWDLNEEIRFHWFKSIQHKLHEFLENKEIKITKQLRVKENEINKVNREISGIEKQISKIEGKKPEEANNKELSLYYQQMSNSYSKIRDKFFRIRDIYLEIANLYVDLINTPRLVEHLSVHQKYGEFSESFFEDRDVAQCIEPLFSKVLGHDRFFPVYVCNKPAENGKIILGHLNGGRNFIDPCDQRCQHHVLGHLYVGDMCSRQTANQLDKNRRTHQLGSVPNRFIHPRIFQ